MLQNKITIFRLLGFNVKIDFSWIFIAILVTWSLTMAFSQYYPEMPLSQHLLMGIGGALGLFISIILHELSHAIVARKYGLPISDITLFIFGGVAEMKEEPNDPKVEFWMALAGPAASFAIGLVCGIIFLVSQAMNGHVMVVSIFGYLTGINLILLIFNLIPAYPTDGGRVLRAVLWKWKGDIRQATRISSTFGSMFGILLIFLGVFSIISGNFIGGMWWCLIGFFLNQAAQMSYKQVLFRKSLKGETVEQFMHTQPVTVDPNMSIQDLVDNYIYKYHYDMYPVRLDDKITGLVTMQGVKEVEKENWPHRYVKDIAQPLTEQNTIAPNMDAVKAFDKIHKSGQTRFLVMDGNDLKGILTLKDLMKFLSIKLELEAEEEIPAMAMNQ